MRANDPRAQFLNALGFSILLVDLQGHGETEGDRDRISFGHREAADVHASVEKLKELTYSEITDLASMSTVKSGLS
jgi:alpha-beta hydrolase superfamily lysophospholipase